jgi:type IV pilus assembly protein PilA
VSQILGEETKGFLPRFLLHVLGAREVLEGNGTRGEIVQSNRATNLHKATSSASARGFSLIELLVVVAVILIIAAIAIPNFIQSKERANESTAVQNLRTITTANVIYSTTYGIGYSATLTNLGGNGTTIGQTNAELIDSVLSTGQKNGYNYTYAQLATDASGNITSYSVNADPVAPNFTGTLHFYTDQSALIRENNSATAGPTDTPIQ